jgi:hypothetical protein
MITLLDKSLNEIEAYNKLREMEEAVKRIEKKNS